MTTQNKCMVAGCSNLAKLGHPLCALHVDAQASDAKAAATLSTEAELIKQINDEYEAMRAKRLAGEELYGDEVGEVLRMVGETRFSSTPRPVRDAIFEAIEEANRTTPREPGDHIDTTWKLEVERAIRDVPDGLDAEGWRAMLLEEAEEQQIAGATDGKWIGSLIESLRASNRFRPMAYRRGKAAAARDRGHEVVCQQDWEDE